MSFIPQLSIKFVVTSEVKVIPGQIRNVLLLFRHI